MADMLVKLYDVAGKGICDEELREKGIVIRRPLAPEKIAIINWVSQKFGTHWASECDVAFSQQPVTCYIALKDKAILGFACYNTTLKGFFGPTGVDENQRGSGIGKSLMLACMNAMYEDGYGYAIIGGAGPEKYYEKTVGATRIEGSVPGIYKGMI